MLKEEYDEELFSSIASSYSKLEQDYEHQLSSKMGEITAILKNKE